jgi:hypothetical protein
MAVAVAQPVELTGRSHCCHRQFPEFINRRPKLFQKISRTHARNHDRAWTTERFPAGDEFPGHLATMGDIAGLLQAFTGNACGPLESRVADIDKK